jgi:hypothetical protein
MRVCYGLNDPVRLPYYASLSAREKRSYRQSDAVADVAVPDAGALRPAVRAVEHALAEGRVRAVRSAASALVGALLGQLGVPEVRVVVRNVRPRSHASELHGQYSYEEGTTPTIEVWMRTAAQRQVVAFRTFMRTLLHEIAHHLDLTLLGLEHTLHTEGFFRRESSLVRQLLGPGRARRAPLARTVVRDEASVVEPAPRAPTEPEPIRPADGRQLRLPF